MKNLDYKVTCNRCKRQERIELMRLDKDGKGFVCRDCLEGKTASQRARGLEKPKGKSEVKLTNVPRTTYKCANCNFEFQRRSDRIVTTCPYCGKPFKQKDDAITASQLLDEA